MLLNILTQVSKASRNPPNPMRSCPEPCVGNSKFPPYPSKPADLLTQICRLTYDRIRCLSDGSVVLVIPGVDGGNSVCSLGSFCYWSRC